MAGDGRAQPPDFLSFVLDGEGLIVPSKSSNASTPFGCRVLRDHGAGGVLLELVGELDIASAPEVNRVLEAVEAEHPGLVVVDLTGLTFMECTGLHLLADADARQRDAGVRLSIVGGGAQPARLLELTGTVTHLPLIDRVPDGSWKLAPATETPGSQADAMSSPAPGTRAWAGFELAATRFAPS